MDHEMYDQLIDGIYSAAISPAQWPHVLKLVNQAFKSNLSGFFIQTHDHRFGESMFEGFAPEMADTYARYYSQVNPWFTSPNLMAPGRVLTDHSLEVLFGHRQAYVNTEYYQDWARLADMRHGIGGTLRDIDGDLLNFTLFRSAAQGHYSQQEIEIYTRLNRHLMKAVAIGNQLKELQADRLSRDMALDQLRLGVVIIDRQKRINHMNAYARNIIARGDVLFEQSSRLRARKPNDNAFDAALSAGLSKPYSQGIQLTRSGTSPLSLCFLSRREQFSLFGEGETSILIFIFDPDDKEFFDGKVIAKKWHLTEREGDIATCLLKGLTTKEISAELELTHYTAQWYVKQVLHKVGVRRQSELCVKLSNDIMQRLNLK